MAEVCQAVTEDFCEEKCDVIEVEVRLYFCISCFGVTTILVSLDIAQLWLITLLLQVSEVVEEQQCSVVEENECTDVPSEVCEDIDVPVASTVPEEVIQLVFQLIIIRRFFLQ